MCTCTDHSRGFILLTEHTRRMAVVTIYKITQDFDTATHTLRTTHITRRAWHRCGRKQLTISVFVLHKFRMVIVQDTKQTNKSLDLVQNGKNIDIIETDTNSNTWQEASLSRSHLLRYQETSYQNKQSNVDDQITTTDLRRSRFREVLYVHCRSHPHEHFPTSMVKNKWES